MAKKAKSSEGYEKLQDLAGKAREELQKALRIIGKEADLSSKLVKGKIDILTINTRIEKRYRELGKEAYNLVSSGEIKDKRLILLCKELDKAYNEISRKKKKINRLKQEIKKVPA